MAAYTHVNLKDVEDKAPGFGLAPNIEARFSTGALELEKGGCGYEKLAPDFRVPFGHKHKQQEEVYVAIAGGGRVKIEDEVLDVKTYDAIRIPPEQTRCFEAGPDGLELVIFGAPNTGAETTSDGEVFPGWWSD